LAGATVWAGPGGLWVKAAEVWAFKSALAFLLLFGPSQKVKKACDEKGFLYH
jgi:hypothetical protein